MWLKKSKILCRGHAINDLSGEEIFGKFYQNFLQKSQKEFRIEKIIKRNSDKLYVKWKDYKSKIVPSGLSNLKSKVEILEIGKLETTPVDLSNLSDAVNMKLLNRLIIMD